MLFLLIPLAMKHSQTIEVDENFFAYRQRDLERKRTRAQVAREESTNGSQRASKAHQSSSNTIQIKIKSKSIEISCFQATAKFRKVLNVIL